MALKLFGVTVNDAHVVSLSIPETELVTVRDLAAICTESEHRRAEMSEAQVTRHSDVVGAYGVRGPVLPAPLGVVFRARDSVERWLELHYGALSGALSFVENRVAGRVHIWRPGAPEERESGVDLASIAAESLRILRRASVATVPLRLEKQTGLVLSAAFLVEQELWPEFSSAVAKEAVRAPGVRFELTGPWPPFDFVQMQLGA